MKVSKLLAPVALAAAALFGASAANAALIVNLASGASTLTVADGDGLDMNPGASGLLTVSVLFNGWTVVTTNGTSIVDPFQMHLGTSVAGVGGQAPLTVKLTQTGLSAVGIGQLFSAWGGFVGAPSGTGSWSAWVDDSNAAFGQGTQVANSANGSYLSANAVTGLSGTYSATIVQTFDFSQLPVSTGQYGASIDVNMAVPEPTSIALVGLALLGAGFASRRKA